MCAGEGQHVGRTAQTYALVDGFPMLLYDIGCTFDVCRASLGMVRTHGAAPGPCLQSRSSVHSSGRHARSHVGSS